MIKRIDLILPKDAYVPSLIHNDFYYSIKENKDFSKSLKENGKYELHLIDEHSGKEKLLGNFENEGNKLTVNIEDISNKNWHDILQLIGYETKFDVIEENFHFKNGRNATLTIDTQNSTRTVKIENFETNDRETNFKELIENVEQIPNEFYIYFDLEDYNAEDIEFVQKSPNGNKFSCTITSYDHLKKLEIQDKEKPFKIFSENPENPEKAKMENLGINEAMIIESSKIQVNSIGEIGELIQSRANDFYEEIMKKGRQGEVLRTFDKTNENEVFKCLRAFGSKVPIKVSTTDNTLTLIKEFSNENFIDKQTNKKIKFDGEKIYIKTTKPISYNNVSENISSLYESYKEISKSKEFKELKNTSVLLDNRDSIIEINKGKLKLLSGKVENLEKLENIIKQDRKTKTR